MKEKRKSSRAIFYFKRIEDQQKIEEVEFKIKLINKDGIYEGKGVKEFFNIIEGIKGELILYTWELEYEGSYIEYYLFREGYEYKTKTLKEGKTFNNLENEQGNYYLINIKDERLRNIKIISLHQKYPRITLGDKSKREILETGEALEEIEKLLKKSWEYGLNSLTIGSDSFNEFKKRLGGKKNFKKIFVEPTDYEDEYLRDSFKGGIVYIKENIEEENYLITVYDINSAYGYILKEKLLPFGKGVFYKGKYKKDETYKLYVQRIKIKCSLKKNMIPFINLQYDAKNRTYAVTDSKGYLISTKGSFVDVKITNYEIEHIYVNYKVYGIEYIDGIKYMGTKDIFKDYIDYYYNLRKKGGIDKDIGKSMIVNLYGKFSNKKQREITRLYYDKKQDEIIRYIEDSESKLIYLPVSIFVTSALRSMLLDVMQKYSATNELLYADTDSVHLIGYIHDNMDIGEKIGQWKIEAQIVKAKYYGKKKYCYMAIDDEGRYNEKENRYKLKAVFSGVSMDKERITYDDFTKGNIIKSKCYKKVKGGTIITTEFIVI